LIKIIILEENFKWHLEAFASELFIYIYIYIYIFSFPMFLELKVSVFTSYTSFKGESEQTLNKSQTASFSSANCCHRAVRITGKERYTHVTEIYSERGSSAHPKLI